MLLNLLVVLATAAGVSARYLPETPPVTTMTPVVRRQETPSSTRSIKRLDPDPWQCITKNVTQYFDFPTPTGALFDAFDTYASDVVAPCRATATGRELLSCTISDPKSWCGFTTAAPADIVSGEYATYLSQIVSFWTEKSESMPIVSTSCPVAWERFGPASHAWLAIVTAHAQCYLDANPTPTSSETEVTVTPTDTTTPLTTTDTTTQTAATSSAANVVGRAQAVEAMALMSAGLAVLANSG